MFTLLHFDVFILYVGSIQGDIESDILDVDIRVRIDDIIGSDIGIGWF